MLSPLFDWKLIPPGAFWCFPFRALCSVSLLTPCKSQASCILKPSSLHAFTAFFQVLIHNIFIWSCPQLLFVITRHCFLDNLTKQADDIHFVGVQSHPHHIWEIRDVFRHLKFHKINKFSDAFKTLRPLILF